MDISEGKFTSLKNFFTFVTFESFEVVYLMQNKLSI